MSWITKRADGNSRSTKFPYYFGDVHSRFFSTKMTFDKLVQYHWKCANWRNNFKKSNFVLDTLYIISAGNIVLKKVHVEAISACTGNSNNSKLEKK